MPTRRLRRGKDREDLFQWLGGQDNIQAPFKRLKDVFVVAACLGYTYGQESKLAPGGEQFGQTVFSAQDEAIFNAIAIAHFGQVEVLHPDREEERLDVIEQYANEGVVLLREMARKGLDPLEEVLAALAREEGERVPGIPK